MSQNEFFNILMDGLKDFPESKLRDIISYYDNKFNHGLTLGKTEEEIVTELGNPNFIVNQYISEFLDAVDNSKLSNTDNYSTFTNTEKFTDDTNNTNNNNNSSNDSNNPIDNSIISTSPINNSKITADNETLSTVNVSDDLSNDFAINDNFNNNENILNTDNTLNDTKTNTQAYDATNSNNDFYNLHTSDQPVEIKDNTYESNRSNNSNYSYKTDNSNYRNSSSTVNTILKFCIIGVTLLIFSPVITAIIGCIIGLFGIAISILVGSIGLLIGGTFTSLVSVPNLPMFVANFPYPVIVLFSLGSISLSLFLTLVFYYLCKFFIRLLIKAYRVLKFKGGDL
ncbi:hypothetical protein CLPUN_19110 [Clostridium puniceum]|uniref:DUF1700 domain-containing protein n=1 Tax=Clostridium puniceum TaxID=29367 RepID=A0A1S8TLQ4_9CLOT|nr:DUF1700 domain-containing protein [Clostridium puniceum]OOM78549.1 hypothetical protein CLPUN_19110 [Clostridium puniceum]